MSTCKTHGHWDCVICEMDQILARKNAEITRLREVVRVQREVLEETALPPYRDSDVASLLNTLSARARTALAKSAEMLERKP